MSTPQRVLVTGATGYVGSRLIPELLRAGHTVLAGTRREGGLDDFPWSDQVTAQPFEVGDDDVVAAAVADVDAVVYLVHSMDGDDFVARDREAAERVARACESAGVTRIVYLSGLIPSGDLSDHLRSRLEVEEVFRSSEVNTIALRAAMVIGAGSTSFELLRRMSERVPLVTPIPSWMCSKLQPVAVEDVVHLISRALEVPPHNQHYDIGGPDVVDYPTLLARFAELDDLRRRQIVIPWVPRGLVGRICARVSGLSSSEVTALVESLSHEMVCREDTVRRDIAEPGYRYVTLDEAITRSLADRPRPGTAAGGDIQASAGTDPA